MFAGSQSSPATARLATEPAPVPDIHFTPGNPRSVRFGILYRF